MGSEEDPGRPSAEKTLSIKDKPASGESLDAEVEPPGGEGDQGVDKPSSSTIQEILKAVNKHSEFVDSLQSKISGLVDTISSHAAPRNDAQKQAEAMAFKNTLLTIGKLAKATSFGGW
jgi:hypothetical protein